MNNLNLNAGDKVVFTKKYAKASFVFTLDSNRSGRLGMRKATPEEIKIGRRIDEN